MPGVPLSVPIFVFIFSRTCFESAKRDCRLHSIEQIW